MIPKFVKYKVMIDPARVRDTLTRVNAIDAIDAIDAAGAPVVVSTPVSAVSMLQDFYLTFQSQFADVSVGQFKIPVSWEGFNSSAKISVRRSRSELECSPGVRPSYGSSAVRSRNRRAAFATSLAIGPLELGRGSS